MAGHGLSAYTLHMATRRRQTSNRKQDVSKVSGIETARGGRSRKLHSTPNYVQEETADPGPWIGVSSSRMVAIRYDYGIRGVFVQFTSGAYYLYESVPLAVFYRLQRAASKGKFISRVLDSYPYRPALPEEALRPTTHVGRPGS